MVLSMYVLLIVDLDLSYSVPSRFENDFEEKLYENITHILKLIND